MKKILFFAAGISSITLLSSCDTTALQQALSATSNNSSGYHRQQSNYHDNGYYRDRDNGYYRNRDNGHYQNRPPQNHYQHNQAQENRNAFQVGTRLGADDFRRGHQKKYMRHEKMYDSKTREKFKSGYYSGYEEARDKYNHSRKKKR